MNGYTGYVTVPFTISPKAVSEVEILKIADVDYTAKLSDRAFLSRRTEI